MVPDIMCAAVFIYTYGNTQSRTKYINCVCFLHVVYIRAENSNLREEGPVGSKVARHWKV